MLRRQHVSDEEFLVLWENDESKNPDFPQDSYDPFTLKNMRDAAECKAEFRVEKKKRSPQACRSLANSRNIKMLPRNRILSLVLKKFPGNTCMQQQQQRQQLYFSIPTLVHGITYYSI